MSTVASLVILFSVLLLGISFSQSSYAFDNHSFELEWGESGKTAPGNFLFPQQISEDNQGNLYVTDLGNSRIQIFDSSGNFINTWGVNGSGAGEFNSPQGIAVTENFVFVSDNILNKIQKFDLDGNFVTEWGIAGNADGEFNSPQGLGINNEILYVVDTGNDRIQKFTLNGVYISEFGKSGFTDSDLRKPVDIAFDSIGNTYVADLHGKKIVKFSNNDRFLNSIDGNFAGFPITPEGIDIDSNDNLYIVDTANNRIVQLDQFGMTLTQWGQYGKSPSQFNLPKDILSANDGYVFVVDTYSHRIQKFETPLVIPTIVTPEQIPVEPQAPVEPKIELQPPISIPNDFIRPVISVPEDIITEAKAGLTKVNIGYAMAYDASGILSLTNNAPEKFPLGTSTIIWTAIDGSGNMTIAPQSITVNDSTPPDISPIPKIRGEAKSLTQNTIELGIPSVHDLVGIGLVENNAPEVFPLGETIVTWTVSDIMGNTSTAEQIIELFDNVNPRISQPENLVIEATSLTENQVDLMLPEVQDNLSIKSLSNDAPEVFPLGETIVTWTATDESGNSASATQLVSVVDTTPPVITIPDNIIFEATGLVSDIEDLGTIMYDDISGISSITNDAPEGFPLGETIVTWSVVDNYDNVSNGSQIITIVDTTNPEIIAPSNIITEASNLLENIVELNSARTSDNVEILTITNNAPEVFPLGETIVTWTATDESGNQSTATQLINVVDTTSPQFVTPLNISLEAQNASSNSVEFDIPSVYDLVGVSSITNNAPEVFPLGETIVTWTATDESGNQSTILQNVTFVDTTNPEIQVPEQISVEATSKYENTVELGVILADDAVGVSSITNNAPEVFPLGETIVTWTATDESGNSSSVVQLILVSDTTLPTIISPVDIEIEATSRDQNIIDLGTSNAIDSVGLANVTNNAPEVFPLGETIVTWTATDESGNSASDTQTIRLVDTVAPIITHPAQIIADATSFTNTIVELSSPQVFDSVSDVRLENDANNSFEFGETIVTWTATDESGNSSSITQSIMIIDESAPVLDIPNNIVLDAIALENVIVIGDASASDFVDENPIITNNAPEVFPLGETIVTWTATDESGNSASSTQNIIVQACGKAPSYYNLILGSNDDDLLLGTNMPDLIFSFYGDDIISADNGNDCILAGEGDDIVFGNEGNDNISGGPGNDIIKGQSGEDILKGGLGLDIADGGDDADVYRNIDESNNDLVLNFETIE